MTDVSLLSLLLRLAISMGVVVALMLLAAKILRKTVGKAGRGGKVTKTPINVAAMQPITKAAHVAVVRAAGRELVVGVTDHQVTLLHSSIEPRADVEDLDVDANEVTDTATPIDLAELTPGAEAGQPSARRRATPDHSPAASARIAPTAGADHAERRSDQGTATAWMDALEMLRERTVRR